MAEKVFLTNRHTNHVSYRPLSAYEKRAPQLYMVSRTAHATFEEAKAHVVAQRIKDLDQARKALKSAVRGLAKAMALEKKAGWP